MFVRVCVCGACVCVWCVCMCVCVYVWCVCVCVYISTMDRLQHFEAEVRGKLVDENLKLEERSARPSLTW